MKFGGSARGYAAADRHGTESVAAAAALIVWLVMVFGLLLEIHVHFS
jgi:hypothetical protein